MLSAGMLLAFQEAAPTAATPRARGWDDFPVFVWREKYAGKPLPEALVEPFGGVILMREEDSSWARERGLSYLVWNVAGRDALHLDADEAWNARVEQWIQTQDPKLLVREPCLNDPKTLERLCTTLDATIAKHGEHPGLGFVLGDEVGLTPNGDPFDLCRCEFCEGEWRVHAREKGIPERAPLTDEVRLQLLDDDFSSLGAWLERRRFERAQLLGTLEHLAQRTRKALGLFPLGLLGIGGPSAFGGIAFAGGLPFVNFVEAYPVNDARELLFAAPERLRRSPHGYVLPPRAMLTTVFAGEESPAGASWKLWEHWLRGGNSVVIWSDQSLEARRDQCARMGDTVRRIRAIEARFPRLLAPRFERIALVQDDDSVALAWLKDALLDGATWPRRRAGYQTEHGTRETRTRDWLRHFEDSGTLPASVPLSRLGELCYGGCSTLVLVHVLVLDPEDVSALEHQLDLGATLIVDGPLGWVDRKGRPWSTEVLGRLRERAPERVHVASDGPVRLAAGASIGPPRDWKFVGESAEQAWLIGSRWTGPSSGHEEAGDLLVAALPRTAGAGKGGPIELGLVVAPSHAVEWVDPPGGNVLAAGDAAVFLLRRRAEESR